MKEYKEALKVLGHWSNSRARRYFNDSGDIDKAHNKLKELVERATRMPSKEELKERVSKCDSLSQMVDVLNEFVGTYYGECDWSDSNGN